MSGATLSDTSIFEAIRIGELVVNPFVGAHVQPSSLDLTIDQELRLWPFKFTLASTAEWVEVPATMQGQVHGRSSIGRLGVLVHFTAGLIDPGFKGRITLECMALDKAQTFYAGDRIAQLSLHWLDQPAERLYAGRYQGQTGAVASRFKHAFNDDGWPYG